MAVAGVGVVVIWWLCHVTGLVGGSSDPVSLYAESSTLGTMLVLFVYVLTAVSLPVFMWRRRRASFSIARHVAVPALGVAALAIPFAKLFEPGQPVPYSVFPYAAVAALVAAIVIAKYVVRRNPRAGAGESAALSEG